MRLWIFRLSSLIIYIISFIVSIVLLTFSIIFNNDTFVLAPVGCGLGCLICLLLLVLSIKNLKKDTCMLVDLAFEKNMEVNRVALIGSAIILLIGVGMLISGIVLIAITILYPLAFALLAFSNFIIFNIVVYYIYMYVEVHY